MTPVDAIKSAYRNYITFSGRAARSEYWWFALFNVVVATVIGLVEGGGSGHMGGGGMMYSYNAGIIGTLWSLGNLLPGLALAVRRLHDKDRSGWWLLIGIIPLIGWIVLLYWYVTKGTEGSNRFGPDPLAADAAAYR